MIEFEIANEEPSPKDPIVTLWLKKDFQGGITVIGEDKNGNSSNLVRFRKNGKIHRCLGVCRELPFVLDKNQIAEE